eukprot:4774224-Lingulodinium_polyedra.AAC.1
MTRDERSAARQAAKQHSESIKAECGTVIAPLPHRLRRLKCSSAVSTSRSRSSGTGIGQRPTGCEGRHR